MNELLNPDSWMDVVAYAVISLPATIGAVAGWRWHKKATSRHEEQRSVSSQTLEQVSNSHPTNLRDDIDEIRDIARDGFKEIRAEFAAVRSELRTERMERIEGDNIRITRTHS